MCNFCAEEELKELEKCKNNPYYFATKYLTIMHNNKIEKFTTHYNEKEFNEIVYRLKGKK